MVIVQGALSFVDVASLGQYVGVLACGISVGSRQLRDDYGVWARRYPELGEMRV